MTYFEPVGRWEGNRIGLDIGTLLRFRGRVSSQCGASASVRAPCHLSPLSTECAMRQRPILRTRGGLLPFPSARIFSSGMLERPADRAVGAREDAKPQVAPLAPQHDGEPLIMKVNQSRSIDGLLMRLRGSPHSDRQRVGGAGDWNALTLVVIVIFALELLCRKTSRSRP
jgi:hypothetical protein